ncbi:MAG: ACT domain-containing protein [Mangrovicoccus sp.]
MQRDRSGLERALADAGLPCNVVAAYHHDHIFVPYDQAQKAVAALQALAKGARGGA